MARKKELTETELLALRALQECLWSDETGLGGHLVLTYVRDIGVGGSDFLPTVLITAGCRSICVGRAGTLRARINLIGLMGDDVPPGGAFRSWTVSEITLSISPGLLRKGQYTFHWDQVPWMCVDARGCKLAVEVE